MCGRYTITAPAEAIEQVFGVGWPDSFARRYNVAPSQTVPIVRHSGATAGRELALVRWGLIPSWAKDAAIGHRLINARGETVASKAAFRESFAKRRCLVIADGFIEWRRTGSGKQPYLIRLASRRPFGMAGLWTTWRDPAGSTLDSCTIITTESNDLCRAIHSRMPAILRAENFDDWLDPRVGGGDLLCPFEAETMEARPISHRASDPRHDDPKLLIPAEEQLSLF